MLSRIHEYSTTITGSNMDEMQVLLEKSNAFRDYDEAKLKMNTKANN